MCDGIWFLLTVRTNPEVALFGETTNDRDEQEPAWSRSHNSVLSLDIVVHVDHRDPDLLHDRASGEDGRGKSEINPNRPEPALVARNLVRFLNGEYLRAGVDEHRFQERGALPGGPAGSLDDHIRRAFGLGDECAPLPGRVAFQKGGKLGIAPPWTSAGPSKDSIQK